jgi:hypothetical protein
MNDRRKRLWLIILAWNLATVLLFTVLPWTLKMPVAYACGAGMVAHILYALRKRRIAAPADDNLN